LVARGFAALFFGAGLSVDPVSDAFARVVVVFFVVEAVDGLFVWAFASVCASAFPSDPASALAVDFVADFAVAFDVAFGASAFLDGAFDDVAS
jgi:hypothetical protein